MLKMMRINKFFLPLLCAGCFLLTRCNDDILAIRYEQPGFVQGKITGIDESGAGFVKDFKLSKYIPFLGQNNTSYTVDPGDGSIEISFELKDHREDSYCLIVLLLDDEDDVDPTFSNFYLYLSEEKDKLFTFYMTDSGNDINLSNFSFDRATGKVTGTYTVDGTQNSTGNTAIINGTFDLIVREFIQ